MSREITTPPDIPIWGVKTDLALFEADLRTEMAYLKAEIAQTNSRLGDVIAGLET